ncbi:MAG TPA: Mut7-C RNAse domain-containing protein [Actinocrinis sp.]|nr:Mut7-C RNAse domain-containing protein [Actinocrinis sp.]
MDKVEIQVGFASQSYVFVSATHRVDRPTAAWTDGTSSLGHVVESLGVPLTEVGALLVDGRPVERSHVPAAGERVQVEAMGRPQAVGGAATAAAPTTAEGAKPGAMRFLLDIHLGTLARRLRLLGVDAAYENPDIGDAALAARSAAEGRVMLSRDLGLLRRKEIFAGAYVYSHQPAEQLDDVLSRFAPTLAPWTRCTACNGILQAATKESVQDQLPDGTERTYDGFAKCGDCGQAYWRGAHYSRLNEIVERAVLKFGAAA